jgi:glycosyltransferase involved in cell wall biosynthesis
MKKFKIVAITQVYNELEKGNLQRFFNYAKNSFDELVVYDDCSTDGSYEYAKKNTQWVLRGSKNDFTSEVKNKQILLETALSLKPDFIFSIDVDEVISAGGGDNSLQALCKLCIEYKLLIFS